MAIIKLQPDSTLLNNQVSIAESLSVENKSNFTTLYPESLVNSLLKYVEGYPWTVNFYGQLLNTENTLELTDPSSPKFTQPYYKITNVIIHVSSPLSSSYDQGTGITSISGSALMPYKVKPNVGDIFLAKVDSGEDAVFTIHTVVRKTHRKDTLYEVEYTLYTYTSAQPLIVSTIEDKVQETYYFNKDTNFFNRDNLLTFAAKEARERLKSFMSTSMGYYFNRYITKNEGTILLPGCGGRYYDPYLIYFILKVTPQDDYLTTLNTMVYSNRFIKQETFFNLLLRRSLAGIENINKTISFVPSNLLRNSSRLGSVYHTGVDYIAYPVSPNVNDVLDGRGDTTVINEFNRGYKTLRNYTPYLGTITTKSNDTLFTKKLLHELFLEDNYIVSGKFYQYLTNNTLYADISFLELMLVKYLQRESISMEDLALCVENYHSWSSLEQLYLLPVLWLLVKSTGV